MTATVKPLSGPRGTRAVSTGRRYGVVSGPLPEGDASPRCTSTQPSPWTRTGQVVEVDVHVEAAPRDQVEPLLAQRRRHVGDRALAQIGVADQAPATGPTRRSTGRRCRRRPGPGRRRGRGRRPPVDQHGDAAVGHEHGRGGTRRPRSVGRSRAGSCVRSYELVGAGRADLAALPHEHDRGVGLVGGVHEGHEPGEPVRVGRAWPVHSHS